MLPDPQKKDKKERKKKGVQGDALCGMAAEQQEGSPGKTAAGTGNPQKDAKQTGFAQQKLQKEEKETAENHGSGILADILEDRLPGTAAAWSAVIWTAAM